MSTARCLPVPIFLFFVVQNPVLAQEITVDDNTVIKSGTAPNGLSADFDFEKNQIALEVYLDREGPFRFMLDSAVHPSVISNDLSKKLGLDLGVVAGISSGFGDKKIAYRKTKLSNVRVGDFNIKTLNAVSTDLDHLDKAYGKRVDGILGHSFLKRLAVRIDYPNRNITLFEKLPKQFLDDKKNGTEYLKFAMEFAGTTPILRDVFVNDSKIEVLVDTGASGSLLLDRRAISRLDLDDEYQKAESTVRVGARGNFTVKHGFVESVKIGSFEQEAVRTIFYAKNHSNLIGNGFFKNYVLTLDYLGKAIFLELPESKK